MKNMVIFVMKGNYHVLMPNFHFSLSAEMDGTQREDTGKSMKNALYVLQSL